MFLSVLFGVTDSPFSFGKCLFLYISLSSSIIARTATSVLWAKGQKGKSDTESQHRDRMAIDFRANLCILTPFGKEGIKNSWMVHSYDICFISEYLCVFVCLSNSSHELN